MDGSASHHPAPEGLPTGSTATSIRSAVVTDLRAAPWRLRLALVVVAFWIAYEWGVGNETVTPWILVRVISATPGWWAVPATAAVGFAFTAIQQLVSGLMALLGFSTFDRTAAAAWSRLRSRFDSVPGEWSTLGWGSRAVVVFTLGTTAVALVQVMTTGAVGVRRHARVIAQSAVLCGGVVGVLGGLFAALADAGRRNDRLAEPTDRLLGILGNPLTWLTILVVVLAVHVVRQRHDRRDPSARNVTGAGGPSGIDDIDR